MDSKSFDGGLKKFDPEARDALQKGEISHQAKMADEKRAAIPSYDESVVSDWIRNRVDLPEDMLKGPGVFKVETPRQPEGEYDIELKKLQTLSPTELKKMIEGVEKKSREGRGMLSRGPLLDGYAIDPETLETLQRSDHDIMDFKLAQQILERTENPNESDSRLSSQDFDEIQRRIIQGFVYHDVPGFETPIVKLYCIGDEMLSNKVPEENVRKIVRFIKGERKFLPIASDYTLL